MTIMKKTYNRPVLEVIKIQTQPLLTVSNVNDSVGNGTQLAPEMDDFDEYFK
jgi:hypothetical protein